MFVQIHPLIATTDGDFRVENKYHEAKVLLPTAGVLQGLVGEREYHGGRKGTHKKDV